jgi:hypothetical protein
LTESIQIASGRDECPDECYGNAGCGNTTGSRAELEFWRFAAEQYRIWLDEGVA